MTFDTRSPKEEEAKELLKRVCNMRSQHTCNEISNDYYHTSGGRATDKTSMDSHKKELIDLINRI